MNEDMKPHDLLRSAARLVERALIQLDVSETPCSGCGSRHFNNKGHARVYQQYTDLPGKLKDSAAMLDGTYVPVPRLTTQQARLAHETRRTSGLRQRG